RRRFQRPGREVRPGVEGLDALPRFGPGRGGVELDGKDGLAGLEAERDRGAGAGHEADDERGEIAAGAVTEEGAGEHAEAPEKNAGRGADVERVAGASGRPRAEVEQGRPAAIPEAPASAEDVEERDLVVREEHDIR